MRPAIILTVLLALSACSNNKTTTVTTADGKEIKITADGDNDAENGTITFEGKDGEKGSMSFGADAAKNGLPLGVPVYPGAKVTGNISGQGDGKGGSMVMMTTSDAPDKVGAFYKAEAEKRGMKSTSTATMSGGMSSFSAENANGNKLVATVTPGGSGENQIMLVIETK